MRKFYFLLFFFMFFNQVNLVAQTHLNNDKPKEKTTKLIYVYGSADCHFCVATKQKLIESKLDFVFYDIDTDKAALSEMLNKLRKANISTNNLGIPVVDKYGEMLTNNADFQEFLIKVSK